MTVQDLIDELNKIEDKTRTVIIPSQDGGVEVLDVINTTTTGEVLIA